MYMYVCLLYICMNCYTTCQKNVESSVVLAKIIETTYNGLEMQGLAQDNPRYGDIIMESEEG